MPSRATASGSRVANYVLERTSTRHLATERVEKVRTALETVDPTYIGATREFERVRLENEDARADGHLLALVARQGENAMPEKKTIERAKKAKREGKAPTTQAGEFVREEIEHIREGKHGAKNAKQAIAIGLSKARRAGVKLPAPKKGTASERTRRQAKRDTAKAKGAARPKSPKRARATKQALKRAPRTAASTRALSRQARPSPRRRANAKKSSSTARSESKRATASK